MRATWSRPFAIVLGLSACSPADFSTPGPLSDPGRYAALHPYYADNCAVSQIRKKPGFGPFISGGPGGHSVLFLGGVCLDHKSSYPVLALCDPTRPDNPDGVGLSVNAHYRNANWVATEGSAFFFDGTLQPGERLTHAVYEQTQQRAKQTGILDGIVFRDYVFKGKPADVDTRDWKYEMSVSTDYAVDFGRGRQCSRVPLTQPQMTRMIGFLNARNAIYRDGHKDFDWNVLQNNCTHLTHNALAAAGVWKEWPIEQPYVFAALSFPVPKNEYVNLMQRTAALPIDDLLAIFHDDLARRTLMADDWLPTQPGTLTESEAPRRDNDIYDTRVELIFYDDPVFGSYAPRYNRFRSAAHWHDLGANLDWFAQLYARIEAERRPLAWWLAQHPSLAVSPHDFPGFYRRYYAYVDEQRRQVEAQTAVLDRRRAYSAATAAGPILPAVRPVTASR